MIMKIDWKTCFRVGISIFLLVLCITYWQPVVAFLIVFVKAAEPLLVGFVIAYLVNILMAFYENYYFPKKKTTFVEKSRRPVCMLAAFITVLGIVVAIVSLIIPELSACIQLLVAKVPQAIENVLNSGVLQRIVPENYMDYLEHFDWQEKMMDVVKGITSGVSSMFDAVAAVVSAVFSALVLMLISVIFAIYLLLGKEKLQEQLKRIIQTYMKRSWGEKLFYVAGILNECFHNYIVGQCIEAVILGTLCALGMTVLRLPYATMIGALIGFTALIPVVGAYIGGGVGAFMIFTVSPIKALIFLVFLVILQQLEGNIIYPKVVGSSIGLPGLWVLAAVTVGGSLMGVLGMLMGVPVAAAVYKILRNDLHNRESQLALGESTGQILEEKLEEEAGQALTEESKLKQELGQKSAQKKIHKKL